MSQLSSFLAMVESEQDFASKKSLDPEKTLDSAFSLDLIYLKMDSV